MGDSLFSVDVVGEDVFDLLPKKLKKSIVTTNNKIGRKVNKEITQDIKSNYNIPSNVTKIGKRIFLRKSRIDKPDFTIIVEKKNISLLDFRGTTQDKHGLNVQIKKGRKRKIRSGFISTFRTPDPCDSTDFA